MLFDRKEKEMVVLMESHFEKVGDALEHLKRTIDLYLEKDRGFKGEAGLVHQLENEADEVKEKILTQLHAGAFMPPNREDYVILADTVDEIANRAQHISNLFVLTRPEIPGFLRDHLKGLTSESIKTFEVLKDVLNIFNQDINQVRATAEKVREQESEVDHLEWGAIKSVSKSLKDLAHKLQLREIIQMIASIADLAEDAGDRFKLMLIKQTF
ncbi:MAG: DUF47 family protein [Candidatus Euphemobacter frigidus]|nr:DUF47 family protein [Candidatus Euphemobacter frigidus]MDP8275630.1 DUF47 family protein [Candidatus Euphemobacter frigidus]